jgi:glycosyltransferase involved in cell wall biosynthesis
MVVVRTIESFYPRMSGPANQAFFISKRLEKKGIRSPVLTSDYEAMRSPAHQKMDGVEVFRFPIMLRIMKYFYTPGMKKELEGFDIVHAHSHRSYQTALGFRAARKAGKPFVISTHGSLLGYDQYLKGLAKLPYMIYDLFSGKKIIRNADMVFVNSRKEYKDATRYGVDKKRICLVPSGVDVDDYTPLKKKEGTIRILFVGRIARNRNIGPIIKAVALLKDRPERIEFIVVGSEVKTSDTSRQGYLSELRQLAKDSGAAGIVRFVGEKRGDELKKIYRTSHIFTYTSLSENFGQTILEAGAAGLPIICTRVGIAPEIITDGKNGFLVKGEPNEIADRIIKLFNRQRRERFGRITRKLVKERFCWESITRKYIDVYRSLVKKGNPGR